ncbi:hypothetical protein DXG01_011320 [Tephrocybe rancida]|nr:hypothetical protein DXG01_011320 [Tephrocybe rancida]
MEPLNIRQFCQVAEALYKLEDQSDFSRFVLSGHLPGDAQAIVDPFGDHDRNDRYRVTRDFDSVIGLEADLGAITSAITMYPIPKREDTLSRSIHLTAYFDKSSGGFEAPIHKIPNLCIGKWNIHNSIRVLIPELWDENRNSPYLTQDELKLFYEKGLRPAIITLLGAQATEWPADYHSELFRARDHHGRLGFMTKILREDVVGELGYYIRESLAANGLSWGMGLVFLIQIRGVKHSSTHTMTPRNADNAFQTFLYDNSLAHDMIAQSDGKWWIDVGLEVISDKGNCLVWRTDSHHHVVQSLCGLQDRVAQRITSPGSSKYTRDMASHLPGVSGCRISPGPQARGEFSVSYLQMYMTDKSVTYKIEGSHYGKFLTCQEVLKGKAEEFLHNLYTLYAAARQEIFSLARVELRVPIEHATTVMMDVDDQLLRSSILSIPKDVWWNLRAWRCLAAKLILGWQSEGSPDHRASRHALLLTASLVWLINGLHSAPDNGASSKNLMMCALPHVNRMGADPNILAFGTPTRDNDVDSQADTDSDDERLPHERHRRDATTLPAYPYGLLFFRSIRVGQKHPVPRFSSIHVLNSTLDDDSFKFFFGTTKDNIETEFFRAVAVRKAHPTRGPNKRRRTAAYHNWGQDPEQPDFQLAAQGVQLEPIPHDRGSDLGSDAEDEALRDGALEDDPLAGGIDPILTQLYRQALVDFTEKAPNPRGSARAGYCVIPVAERSTVTEAAYKSHVLSDYFRDCQYKIASPAEWTKAFDALFPPRGVDKTGAVQNYGQSLYYARWLKLRQQTTSDKTLELFRQALKSRFNKLYWIPAARTDRIWATKPEVSYKKLSALPANVPSPQIFINPLIRTRPQWNSE